MKNPRFDINLYRKELTPKSSWLLGWILSDGCVYNNRLKITLNSKDKEVLIKIQKVLKHSGNIIDGMCYNKETPIYHSTVSVYNKLFTDSLVSFNIVSRKSLIIEFPNTINQKYLRHFVRGYFEGDGCVGYIQLRNCIKINFKGTLEFLTSLKRVMKNCLGINGFIYKANNTTNNTYNYDITGNISSIKFLNWIYSDSKPSMRLNRKYNRAKELYKLVASKRKTEIPYKLAI